MGHTHEDVDKIFSCISRAISKRTILTIPGEILMSMIMPGKINVCIIHADLLDVVGKSDTVSQPTGHILTTVFSVREWISGIAPALHDHLKAHQFKFERVQGKTRMFYKQWSTDVTWLPQHGMDLLQSGVSNDIFKLATSSPLSVVPKFDINDYKKLEGTISKVKAYLEKSGASDWWQAFLLDVMAIINCDNEHELSQTACGESLFLYNYGL